MVNSLESLAGSLGLNAGNSIDASTDLSDADISLNAVYAAESMEAQKDVEGFMLLMDVANNLNPTHSEEGFKDVIKKFWEKVKEFFRKIGAWFKNLFKRNKSDAAKTKEDCKKSADTKEAVAKVLDKADVKEPASGKTIGEEVTEKLEANKLDTNLSPDVAKTVNKIKTLKSEEMLIPIMYTRADTVLKSCQSVIGTIVTNDFQKSIDEITDVVTGINENNIEESSKKITTIINNIRAFTSQRGTADDMIKKVRLSKGKPLFSSDKHYDVDKTRSVSEGLKLYAKYERLMGDFISNKNENYKKLEKDSKTFEKNMNECIDAIGDNEKYSGIIALLQQSFALITSYTVNSTKALEGIYGGIDKSLDRARGDVFSVSAAA